MPLREFFVEKKILLVPIDRFISRPNTTIVVQEQFTIVDNNNLPWPQNCASIRHRQYLVVSFLGTGTLAT